METRVYTLSTPRACSNYHTVAGKTGADAIFLAMTKKLYFSHELAA